MSAFALTARAQSTLKAFTALVIAIALPGCGIGYLVSSAYNQADLLSRRVDVNEAIRNENQKLTPDEIHKMRLADEARIFAYQELGLKKTKNYTRFVQLDRPYVTYVVSAAQKWRLESYTWWFPIVGHMPYKGYFNLPDAQKEEAELQEKNLDTYVRGVSAFSTLGWLEDPLLSSMLKYSDYDLVNTIIHETMHATVFIRSEADFNERLATFMGTIGAEEFYRKREGPDSKTVLNIRGEMEDEELFGHFISIESDSLEKWYKSADGKFSETDRQLKFSDIKKRFQTDVLPKLKTDTYRGFADVKLNNARLLLYKLYIQDLSDFSRVFARVDRSFKKMVAVCRSLEKSDDPEADLKKIASGELPITTRAN